MPLTLETASALVPGGVSPRAIEQERKTTMQVQKKPAAPETLKVRVVRPFYYKGKPVEKDATVELPRVFALEMKDAKKAEVIVEAVPQAEPVAPASEKKADTGKKER
jgi:hypothetical protein